jgi:hypothetical protein
MEKVYHEKLDNILMHCVFMDLERPTLTSILSLPEGEEEWHQMSFLKLESYCV